MKHKVEKRLVVVLEKRQIGGPDKNGDVFPGGTWVAQSVRPMTILEHIAQLWPPCCFKKNNKHTAILAKTTSAVSIGVTINKEQYAKLLDTGMQNPISVGSSLEMELIPEPDNAFEQEAAV